jgi:hypothetical protein
MAMFPLQLQIISDLHLETPLNSPSYSTFTLSIQASNLCLLGDIGLVKDPGLFAFLRRTLEQSRGTRIFYVIGNHEPYQLPYALAVQKLRDFETEATANYGGRFILLNRNRYDLDSSTIILGCTLWTAILPAQATEAALRLTDFNEHRGIRNWTISDHLEQHRLDVEWLDSQVREIRENEPHRQIVVLTHHSPTLDLRATDPRHRGSVLSSGFATDLSGNLCWTSEMVGLWAFGHTHYNCEFRDEGTERLVVANQKGYQQLGKRGRRVKSMVVEMGEAGWDVVKVPDEKKLEVDGRETLEDDNVMEFKGQGRSIVSKSESTPIKRSLFSRAADRIRTLRRSKSGSSYK